MALDYFSLFSPPRHSRESGNPVCFGIALDARLRGHDDLNSYHFEFISFTAPTTPDNRLVYELDNYYK